MLELRFQSCRDTIGFMVTPHGLSATTKHENVSRKDAKIAKKEGSAAALGGSLDEPAFGRFICTGSDPVSC
jgi:hypothetical protein